VAVEARATDARMFENFMVVVLVDEDAGGQQVVREQVLNSNTNE
jgi:hypothetical protein